MKTVSVIVPAYNVENYIARCLDSLIAQTLENMEIIIVNDASTDTTQDIIDSYVAKYPDLIFSYIKPNGGIADVRNYALEKITGEFFGFLDSDDYAESDMYEKMYALGKKENADLVSSNFYWEYPNKTTVGHDGPYGSKKDMLVKCMATLWSKIYRTEIIKSMNFSFPTGYRYEDVYFLYCLAPNLNGIAHVDQPFVHYVQRKGSITHANDSRVRDMLYVFKEIIDYYRENNIFDEYHSELEYLYAKFFLGNSLLRTLQIPDREFRTKLITQTWELLNTIFPEWKKNVYLKQESLLRRIYYMIISKGMIKIISPFLRFYINYRQRILYD